MLCSLGFLVALVCDADRDRRKTKHSWYYVYVLQMFLLICYSKSEVCRFSPTILPTYLGPCVLIPFLFIFLTHYLSREEMWQKWLVLLPNWPCVLIFPKSDSKATNGRQTESSTKDEPFTCLACYFPQRKCHFFVLQFISPPWWKLQTNVTGVPQNRSLQENRCTGSKSLK